jgi:hypothetical protein
VRAFPLDGAKANISSGGGRTNGPIDIDIGISDIGERDRYPLSGFFRSEAES